MADRGAPRAVFKNWAHGQDLRFGRDQFDVCVYGLAEIDFSSAPTACRRSFLPVCLQLVGDQFFQCAYSLTDRLCRAVSGFFKICHGVRTPWMLRPYTFVMHTRRTGDSQLDVARVFSYPAFFARLAVSSCPLSLSSLSSVKSPPTDGVSEAHAPSRLFFESNCPLHCTCMRQHLVWSRSFLCNLSGFLPCTRVFD